VDEKENTFISLSGVPYEMKYLVENENHSKVVKNTNDPILLQTIILMDKAKVWFQNG
jgi:molybdopterin-biosynthesis enzyme MoeA-like protein